MCGIVGYVGHRDAVSILLPALRRLEYRGYDSAGVATVARTGLDVRKALGKIAALEGVIAAPAPRGPVGIAHTRWATHGRPSVANAHPHVDCESHVAVVHNGIIENYRELRRDLLAEGHRFRSDTDTEVIAHLIERYRTNGLAEAVLAAARDLRGTYAVACVAADEPGTLVAVRGGGSPLIIGLGHDEVFLASDIPALLRETREVLPLGERELAVLRADGVVARSFDGFSVRRPTTTIALDPIAAEKGGYPHFMLKEIFEQPESVTNTIRDRIDIATGEIEIPELGLRDRDLAALSRLCLVACGTSWHAALVGKYLIEALARVPTEVDVASEFRYRQPILDDRVLTIPVSQSGETADTLAALREAREHGSRTLAICNTIGSSLAREADGVLDTRAGLEIGVASTKTFTAQVAALTLLALKLGLARGVIEGTSVRETLGHLSAASGLMARVLDQSDSIRRVADRFVTSCDFLYLGRAIHYPLALEGALKLKEISYIHAEGYPAGEIKHGPIALVDQHMPVVAIALYGPTYDKMASNVEEVKAREGIVIALATEGDNDLAANADVVIPVPAAPYWIQPLVVAVPLHLLAYHLGVLRGCDVDQPRNLAKSVTVE